MEHLADRGHQRVMYLAGPSFSLSNAYRKDAFDTTAQRRGIEALTLGPFEPDFMTAGSNAVDAVIKSKVTAVIGFNDQVAVGLITELHRRGIQPGVDLAVAGFDGSWLCETTSPSLTSVELPFTNAIRDAVLDVIDLIEGREPIANRELPSKLVVRESTTWWRGPQL